MRKVKIYLAKSNLCSLELAARVRSYLSSINNVEVIEFKGGEYSHVPLKESDILIIVPPKNAIETSTITTMGNPLKGIFIGRGTFEQMKEFSRVGAARAKRFFVRENEKTGEFHFVIILGSTLTHPKEEGHNWTTHWGALWTDDRIIDMDRVVEIHSKGESIMKTNRSFHNVFKSATESHMEGKTGLTCDITLEQDLKPLLIKQRNKLKT